MRTLAALTYADRHAFLNALRGLRRTPWRAVLWIFWLLLVVGFGWLRTRPSAVPSMPLGRDQLATLDAWACSPILILAAVLITGPRALVRVFSSRGEALMFVRAPLPAAVVVAFLQVRSIAAVLVQTLGRFAYLLVLVVPVHTTGAGLAREGVLLIAATIAVASIPLPRALARGGARIACIAAGIALAVAAVLPLVRDALVLLGPTPASAALAHRLPAWHPGGVLTAVAYGDPRPVLWMLLFAVFACAAFVGVARDAYPELYAISVAHLEMRRVAARRAARGGVTEGAGTKRRRSASIRVGLRGGMALVWLDAVTWSRRVAPMMTAALGAGCFVLGAGLGVLGRATEPAVAAAALGIALPQLYLAYASSGSIRLAIDLRKPLFWLGRSSLAVRLAAWSLAPLWRDAAFLSLLALGYATLAHDAALAETMLLGSFALALLSRAVGVAVFAILPNALDQGGPSTFLRLLVAYGLVVPIASAAILTGIATGSPVAGAAVAFTGAAVEAALLIAFAAWRFAGRIDRLSTA